MIDCSTRAATAPWILVGFSRGNDRWTFRLRCHLLRHLVNLVNCRCSVPFTRVTDEPGSMTVLLRRW